MSFRSASRLSRSIPPTLPLATRTAVVARRAASSHGGGSGGNDMQWALGSAVVFIPLAAWILMPSNESHEHTPSHIHTSEAVDQHGRVGIQTTHADDTGTGGNEMPSNNPGRKNEGGEQFEPDEDTSQGGEDEGGPSKQDVMDSLKRSERTNVPRAAMSEEVRGNQTQHEKDEKEGGGGSDEDLKGGGDEDDAPSPEEIQASLHQSENAAVPRAAMAAGEK